MVKFCRSAFVVSRCFSFLFVLVMVVLLLDYACGTVNDDETRTVTGNKNSPKSAMDEERQQQLQQQQRLLQEEAKQKRQLSIPSAPVFRQYMNSQPASPSSPFFSAATPSVPPPAPAPPPQPRVSIKDNCITEIYNVDKEMSPQEQDEFCAQFLGFLNQVLSGDDICEYEFLSCSVTGQEILDTSPWLQRRSLGDKKEKKHKKNKVKSKNKGECNELCKDEEVFSGANRRALLEELQQQQRQQLLGHRHLDEGLSVEQAAEFVCFLMLKLFSAEPSPAFHGMDRVDVTCDGVQVVSCSLERNPFLFLSP